MNYAIYIIHVKCILSRHDQGVSFILTVIFRDFFGIQYSHVQERQVPG